MKLLLIAFNTIRHAVRMKFVIALVIFLLVIVVTVPFSLKSNTPKGQVQITISYCLGVLNIVLSLLTIFVSTSSFCSEIRDKTIFTIDTKPVKRWQIIIGKWIGIMGLNAILLVCAGAAVYGLVRYITRAVEDKEPGQNQIKTQVLTARVETNPRNVDRAKKTFVVRQRYSQDWQFGGIKTRSKQVSIKFRNFSPTGQKDKIAGIWLIGDMETGFYRKATAFPGGSFHEFPVPAAVVSPEGKLKVKFLNISAKNTTAIFPVGDISVLYNAGGFGGNLARGLLLIMLRLIFVSIVALTASTFLTLPVATLLALFVFAISLSLPFVHALLGQTGPVPVSQTAMGDPADIAGSWLTKVFDVILRVFPDLRAYDPVPLLSNGLLVGWSTVLRGFLGIVVIRCGIIAMIGCAIFNRRELANMGY